MTTSRSKELVVPSDEILQYEESDRIATVTFNRPDVHNAFNAQMQQELHSLCRMLRRPKARVECGPR
jgi:enoyl-CoA hydratase/carnithine racemase